MGKPLGGDGAAGVGASTGCEGPATVGQSHSTRLQALKGWCMIRQLARGTFQGTFRVLDPKACVQALSPHQNFVGERLPPGQSMTVTGMTAEGRGAACCKLGDAGRGHQALDWDGGLWSKLWGSWPGGKLKSQRRGTIGLHVCTWCQSCRGRGCSRLRCAGLQQRAWGCTGL